MRRTRREGPQGVSPCGPFCVWGNRELQRLRAFVAHVPFMRGYEIVELLKGAWHIVWEAIAGFPVLADLLHGRVREARMAAYRAPEGPQGGSIPTAGPFCIWGGFLALIPFN